MSRGPIEKVFSRYHVCALNLPVCRDPPFDIPRGPLGDGLSTGSSGKSVQSILVDKVQFEGLSSNL